MTKQRTIPYGQWPSPLTAADVATANKRLNSLYADGDNLYWCEARPQEEGRGVIMRANAAGIAEITPAYINVRTRVHEYGGGAFCVADQQVYCANDKDGCWYTEVADRQWEQVSTSQPGVRYAEAIGCQEHLICVRESIDAHGQVRRALVALSLIDMEKPACVLTTGHQFYASACLSEEVRQLAWIQWDHPHMPWDSSQLCVATLNADMTLGPVTVVAGGPNESVMQPTWHPDGRLYFASDRSGWWNLYQWDQNNISPILPMQAEFATPLWVLGTQMYTLFGEDDIISLMIEEGVESLVRIRKDKSYERLPVDCLSFAPYLHTYQEGVAFIGTTASTDPAVMYYDVHHHQTQIITPQVTTPLSRASISVGKPIVFPTAQDQQAHAFYYAPRLEGVTGETQSKPPLLVMCHGGPSSMTKRGFSRRIQYWTSRGIAVVDVNYGGSTGFGREYRNRLQGQWGVVDVVDCTAAVDYLVAKGWVDAKRVAITGSSSGGYTVLCGLTFTQHFSAGASYYGIGDLTTLVADTHDFESHYVEGLVGPYPAAKALYQQRSPLTALDQLHVPIIIFQGLEDKVVPPQQAEAIVAALKTRQSPYAYLTFAHEQHGFREAKTIEQALASEFYFYMRVWGIETQPVHPALTIHYLT